MLHVFSRHCEQGTKTIKENNDYLESMFSAYLNLFSLQFSLENEDYVVSILSFVKQFSFNILNKPFPHVIASSLKALLFITVHSLSLGYPIAYSSVPYGSLAVS